MMAMTTKQKGGMTGGVVALILASVFAAEGGYVDNPKDPGGKTNMGITENVARANGYEGNMRALPKELASSIYFKDYIQKPGYEPFLEIQPAIAEELVDTGVNTGPARPSRWLQISLNSLNRDGKDYPSLTVDGKVGTGTINAYKSLERVRGKIKACEMTLKLLDAHQAVYYVSLTNLKTFTPGWVDNRVGNVPLSHCSK